MACARGAIGTGAARAHARADGAWRAWQDARRRRRRQPLRHALGARRAPPRVDRRARGGEHRGVQRRDDRGGRGDVQVALQGDVAWQRLDLAGGAAAGVQDPGVRDGRHGHPPLVERRGRRGHAERRRQGQGRCAEGRGKVSRQAPRGRRGRRLGRRRVERLVGWRLGGRCQGGQGQQASGPTWPARRGPTGSPAWWAGTPRGSPARVTRSRAGARSPRARIATRARRT